METKSEFAGRSRSEANDAWGAHYRASVMLNSMTVLRPEAFAFPRAGGSHLATSLSPSDVQGGSLVCGDTWHALRARNCGCEMSGERERRPRRDEEGVEVGADDSLRGGERSKCVDDATAARLGRGKSESRRGKSGCLVEDVGAVLPAAETRVSVYPSFWRSESAATRLRGRARARREKAGLTPRPAPRTRPPRPPPQSRA